IIHPRYTGGFCGLSLSPIESLKLSKSRLKLLKESPPVASAAVGPIYLSPPKPITGMVTKPKNKVKIVHNGTSLQKLFINKFIYQILNTMFTQGTKAATIPHQMGLPTISAIIIML